MRFQKGYPPANLTYPFTSIPTDPGDSILVSPRIGNSHGLATPTFPGDPGFEDELNEVVEVRMQVVGGKWPADFLARHHPRGSDFDPERMPVPLAQQRLSTSNPKGCANVVHMDHPYDMPRAVLTWLTQQRARLKTKPHDNFLTRVGTGDLAPLIQGRIMENLEKAFEAKYHFGRPRPEECSEAGLSCVDPGELMTHYPEGAPCHPAYPAGHGAAAASVQVILDEFELTTDQEKEIFDCAYHWAMYRTFAGVHYANDNLAGLEVGGLL